MILIPVCAKQLGSFWMRGTQDNDSAIVPDQLKDPLAEPGRVGGSYPWRLQDGFTTVLPLKNTIDQQVYALIQVRYSGGAYHLERLPLAPFQTVAVDILALRDGQQKDIRGGLMPKAVSSGQVVWYEETSGSLIGRAEVRNLAQALASSFSCGQACECGLSFQSAAVSPSSFTAVVGDTASFLAQEMRADCYSSFGPYNRTGDSTWTTSNSSVATVSGGTVQFVGAGSVTVHAQFSATVYANFPTYCSIINPNPNPGSGVAVQQPTYFKADSVTQASWGETCNGAVYAAKVVYKVYDQTGTAQIQREGMVAEEVFTITDDAGNNVGGITEWRAFSTPQATATNGIVNDIPIGSCISPPPPPNRCFSVTQLFRIVVPNIGNNGSQTFDIETETFRRDCQQGIEVRVTNPRMTDQVFTLGTVN